MTDTITTVLLTFRDTLRQISPPWLQTGLAEKVLYSMGLQLDAFGDALVAGVQQRFPGYYSFDSLSALGRERRIYRGLVETDEQYAARLAGFFASHRTRGGPYVMLEQIYLYHAPNNFPVDLVYVTGRRYHMDMAGVVTRDNVTWAPDGDAAKWARWWLFYYTEQWAFVPPTEAEISVLRQVPRQWNAAHPIGQIVLFSSGAELWNWPPGHVWNEPGLWNVTGGAPRYIDVEPV